MPAFILQFAGSLAAILAIVWLVRRMGLGAHPVFGDHKAVQIAAEEASDGFSATSSAIDREGRTALARNDAGHIMVLKPHGGHIAGRILGQGTRAGVNENTLTVDCGEKRFGRVALTLDDPAPWAEAINGLSGYGNA